MGSSTALDNEMHEFGYDASHLCVDLSNPIDLDLLDHVLQSRWKSSMERGHFRYMLPSPIPSTILPGRYNFILQLNPDRGSKRRPPEQIATLTQPFDPTRFHFNLVAPQEVLLQLRPWWDDQAHDHSLLINVSPLETGHVLLTPHRSQNRAQALSRDGLRLALELALLSRDPNFRVGFNSLCGYASVNHEHYHAYYLQHRLYLETAALRPLKSPTNTGSSSFCFELVDYPAPALVWTLERVEDLSALVERVMTVAKHLHATNTAHNMFITRGETCSASSSTPATPSHHSCLRVFLWARESSFGSKESDGFNPALCELAGHFPCKSEEAYGRLKEDGLVAILRDLCAKSFACLRAALVEGQFDNVA